MINLLPKEQIKQLHASRQNTLLLRYVLATGITLCIAIAIHAATLLLLKSAERSNLVTSKENQARVEEYREIREKSEEYIANLKTANSLFEKKVPYTNAITNITNTLPKGVILQNVLLDQQTIGQPTTLTARAKSYETSIQLKEQLQDSPIAKDVSLSMVSDDRINGVSSNQEYPFTVTVNLTYTPDLLKPAGDNQ